MCKDMNPIGSVYCNASRNPSFKRGIYDAENGVRCLKSEQHDTAVVLEVPIGVIDDQGRTTKKCSISDLVPTLRSQSHGNEAKAVLEVEVKEATKQGYAIARGGGMPSTLQCQGARQEGGRVGVDMANTLDTSCNQGIFVEISPSLTVYAIWYPKKQCYIAIRKLTPKECFRLQGWTDDYFEKAQLVNSDSQLYKQAGNGVTVTVIKAIAERMKV